MRPTVPYLCTMVISWGGARGVNVGIYDRRGVPGYVLKDILKTVKAKERSKPETSS